MELVKKDGDLNIFKKRSGRFGVKNTSTNKWLNGTDKIQVLVKEGLIKAAIPKKEEPAQEEAPAETTEEA